MIIPWLRQESLPPTLSGKPCANSSYNHTPFTTTAEHREKPSVGEEDIGACLRLPCLQSQRHPGWGARVGNTSQEPHSIRCSPAPVLNHSHMKPRWFPEWGRRVCCLHKQCHISVNIICHPDILDQIQFPLGFAQLGTWLLQQTANSICANACLRQICLRQTHIFTRWSLLHLAWREDFRPINLCFQPQLRQKWVNSSSPAQCRNVQASATCSSHLPLWPSWVSSGSFGCFTSMSGGYLQC